MKKVYLLNAVLKRGFILLTFLLSNSAMAIEQPKYEIVESEGDFEIRHYLPMLIAEVEVDGDMDQASNKGFRLIADFIFGNNLGPNLDDKTNIPMTAPVTVEPK